MPVEEISFNRMTALFFFNGFPYYGKAISFRKIYISALKISVQSLKAKKTFFRVLKLKTSNGVFRESWT